MEQRYKRITNYILELGYDKLGKNELDVLTDQIKFDFDLYRKDFSIGSIILIVMGLSLIFYNRLITVVTETKEVVFITSVLFVILVTKNIYEAYRSRIIYLSLQAIKNISKFNVEQAQGR